MRRDELVMWLKARGFRLTNAGSCLSRQSSPDSGDWRSLQYPCSPVALGGKFNRRGTKRLLTFILHLRNCERSPMLSGRHVCQQDFTSHQGHSTYNEVSPTPRPMPCFRIDFILQPCSSSSLSFANELITFRHGLVVPACPLVT